MSEWLSYSLSDFLLFAPRTYYRLFALHNEALWPLHLGVLAAAAAILVLALAPAPPWRGRAIAVILAAAWLFVAWAWLLQRYDGINFAGRWFAAAFAAEALLLLIVGVLGDGLQPAQRAHPAGMAGLAVFAAAVALYPLLGLAYGRDLASAEVFGIAPDPTAIGTLGLLLVPARVPWLLLPIPLAWSAVTGLTLWTMGAPDAFVPPLAAALTLVLALWKTFGRRIRA